MSGIVIRVPGVFTATGLPKYVVDPRIAAGTLVLADLTHSAGGIDGVPANGDTIPNVAWDKANALVSGSPGQSALALPFATTDTFPSATFPLVERTPKKGLHVIRSQTDDVSGKYAEIQWPAAVQDYLLTNKAHAYFLSAIQRFTRAFTTAGSPFPGISLMGSTSSNLIAGLGISGTFPAGSLSSTKIVGNFVGNANGGLSAGLSMMEVAVTQPTGTVTSIGSNAYVFGGTGGPFSGLHVGGSQIFYSLLLEDLTVSAADLGITVAERANQLVAIELQNYNAITGDGGKIDGDTWTDPSGYP